MLEVAIHKAGYSAEKTILTDLAFHVEEGEVLAIVGQSGAGKSTLLKTIAGLIPYLEGGIKMDGRTVKKSVHALIPGDKDIALVTQDFNEDLYFTAEENIKAAMLHLLKEDQSEFLEELIAVMDIEAIRNKQSRYLSGGEKQRVSLACALAKEPLLLLLDEPFAHIDVHLRQRIGNYLRNLVKEKNIALIWVSHEGEEALGWGDSILINHQNNWLGKFSPKEVYFDQVDQPYAYFFGEVNRVKVGEEWIHFRPWDFSLEDTKKYKVVVNFKSCSLRNGYFSNYFETTNKEELVLFAREELKMCKKIYVD
jgi:ABC-type multidrug transport system ATPase subunit